MDYVRYRVQRNDQHGWEVIKEYVYDNGQVRPERTGIYASTEKSAQRKADAASEKEG